MTLHLVDCSRHQVERPDPLDLAEARAAGMGAVNIQLDRGRQADELPAWARTYADRARQLGMGICTYRFLDNRIPGAESARRAFERIVALGGPAGMAHAVDCEENATETILRAYVTTMQGLLGRPIMVYSADWWLEPRGWRASEWTPYLWAAPNVGYLTEYPGDASPHWAAGYGGYQFLSAMQYAVRPLPGTGNCSLSAIRDPSIWAALTGGAVPTYTQLQAESWWNREIYTDAMKFLAAGLRAHFGVAADAVGCKGDNRHLNGGHRSQEWIQNSWWCTSRSYTAEAGLTAEQARYLSAFDFTPGSAADMLLVSQRLDKATRSGQLEEVVEWFGNVDGDTRVDGWNNIENRIITSDSSHLWHLHLRVRRSLANNMDVARKILAVLTGTTTPTATPTGRKPVEYLAQTLEPNDGTVYRGDGRTCVPVEGGEQTVRDLVKMGADGSRTSPFYVPGARPFTTRGEMFQRIGWPKQPEPPAELLTDEQVAMLAAALVAADNPLGPDDQPAIEAAVKAAILDLLTPRVPS